MKLPIALVAFAFTVLAGTAGAQDVYKSTMPDGKVIYGEKPTPGAKKVDKVETPAGKTGVTIVTPQEKARAEQQAKDRASASATTAAKQGDVEEARRQLQKAEAARKAGEEPSATERQGTAGGKSRLTEEYFERQKKLEQAEAEARRRVQDLERGGR